MANTTYPITLVIPEDDTVKLWNQCSNLAQMVDDMGGMIADASYVGLPTSRLESDRAEIRVNLEICLSEYNRRTTS